MEFKPCAVIPSFRHADAVRPVIQKLLAQNLPIILVDDGNSAEELQILQKIAHSDSRISLISLAKNGGKGSAVCAGLREAYRTGYSHALQIDADGQHNPEAIPFFLKASQKHLDCLVGGFPQYDDSAPKGRKIGRKITNFWVSIETLSFAFPDAMCGFRVYPLWLTEPILKQIQTFRMGFDIEILVRLSWAGVRMYFYPIQVIYPKDGVSNFRMWRDNVEISCLHTRLCFGMLLRLPKLLKRKSARGKK